MIGLSIETSCDETAASIIKDGREVLSNVVATQIDIHKKYGGVVPEIASRKHISTISQVVEEALNEANIDFKDILKSIGLDELFNANSLNRAFEYVDENGFSLEYIKQKNNVEFSELGTVIKSFTISMGSKATSFAPLDTFTLEVKLNSPFIYVIRDVNGLPLYIGNVSNL